MDKFQKYRRECQALPKGYYHLCTDGWKDGLLFHNENQFAAGVTSIALMALKLNITIYGYVLMPNHVHILLSGTGADAVKAFNLLVRRIDFVLNKDHHPPLPQDYWFKLIPIESPESLRAHYLYLARNPYEKGYCIPGGYPWGSDYLMFSNLAEHIIGEPIKNLKKSFVSRLTCYREPLPDHWEIHPVYGILPRSFVNTEKVYELFDSPKAYLSRMVKDYEKFIHIAGNLEDPLNLENSEVEDIILNEVQRCYPGKSLKVLDPKEKYQLAALLHQKFGLTAEQLCHPLRLSEYSVRQAFNAKEFRRY